MNTPRLLVLATLFALTPSCQQKVEGALRVNVTSAPNLVADCLRVTISDGNTDLRWVTFARAKSTDPQQVAVVKADEWPATVSIAGSAWLGDCADEPKLVRNARTAKQSVTFPATDVLEVSLFIDAPSATDDVDRDGYSAGPDCNDADRTIFPGSVQLCSVDVDTDCNGLAGCADTACGTSVDCANPPDRLAFKGLPATTSTNTCLDFTVELRNAMGPRAATARTSLGVSGTTGVTVFDGPGCAGQAVSTLSVAFKGAAAIGSARVASPGSATLTATGAGFTPGAATLVVQPQQWMTLRLAGLPATQGAGGCSGPVTLTLLDGVGAPTTVSQPLTLALSATPADAHTGLFTTATCSGAPAATVDVPAGSGTVTLYFGAQKADLVTVRATVGMASANGQVTVTPGAGTKLAFLNQRLSFHTYDACSAALTLEVRDTWDNPSTSPRGVQLRPSSSLAGVSFYGDSNCMTQVTGAPLALGDRTASFFMKASQAGADATFTITPDLPFAAVTQQFDVSQGQPASIAFTNPARITAAGDCSAELNLELRDLSGVLSSYGSPQAVTLTTSLPMGASLAFFTQPGCAGAGIAPGGTFDFPAGQSQARLYLRALKVSPSFSVSAALLSLATATSAGHSIIPGARTQLKWTLPTVTTVGAGTCSQRYTLTVYDANDNLAPFTVDTALTLSPGAPTLSYDTVASQCQAADGSLLFPAGSTGTVGFQVRGTALGAYQLSAQAGSASTMVSAPFTVTPGAAQLNLTVPTGTPTVVAGTCQELRFERVDGFGNPAPASPLTLSLTDAGVTVYDTLTACQSSTGATASFPSDGGVRSVWAQPRRVDPVPVTVGALMGGVGSTAALAVTAAPAAKLLVEGLPVTRASSACAGPVTARRRDAFNNEATNDGPATYSVVAATGALVTSSGDCSGPAAADTAISFAPDASVSGPFSVSAPLVGAYVVQVDGGLPLAASGTLTVTPGPATKLVYLTTASSTLETATCSGPVTVRLTDEAGNAINTSGVTLSLDAGPVVVAFSPGAACSGAAAPVTDGGVATFSFVAPSLPQAALTVSATGPGLTTPTQDWGVVLGPPRALAWKAAPPTTLARYVCSNAVTLELRDYGGNVVTTPGGVTATVAAASLVQPGLTLYADPTCAAPLATTNNLPIAAGTSESNFYLAGTGTGLSNISASVPMLASPAPQPVTVSGAQGSLALATASADLEAGGCVALTVTRTPPPTTTVSGAVPITFTGLPASGVTLHAAIDCSDAAATGFSMPTGVNVLTVYARGRSVAANTAFSLVATDASGGLTSSPAVPMTTYPLVRRGTCTIAASVATSGACPVVLPSTDISRTFLVFQAASGLTNANEAFVRCFLKPSATDVQVVCDRKGSPGTAITITWQTVSWGRSAANGGVTVQHLQNSIAAVPPSSSVSASLTTAVADVSKTFVLFSSNSGTTGAPNVADFYTAKLTSTTNVDLVNTGNFPATDWALQVVEFAAITVDRNSITNNAMSPSATATTTRSATKTSPLFSARSASGGNSSACKFRLRAWLAGGTLNVHRAGTLGTGGGNPRGACADANVAEVAYELIEWPSTFTVERPTTPATGANAFSLTLANNSATAVTWTPTLANVPHKTLVYLPGQGPSGQSSGETERFEGDETGTGLATVDFSASPANLVHATGGTRSAYFTPYAVMFEP